MIKSMSKKFLSGFLALVLWSPIFSATAFYRSVPSDHERTRGAIKELVAYYAKSPGFKTAKVIIIDTVVLNEWADDKRVSRMYPGNTDYLKQLKRGKGVWEEAVSEWEAKSQDEELVLRRNHGRFSGSYRSGSLRHFISPYRSGGEWMTIMLVYENQGPQCGMGVREKHIGVEVDP